MTASEYGGTTRDYTYEQDMVGRLTRQVQNVFSPNSTTTYNYEWDAMDRMTKVQKVASGVTKTINYTYNASGLRVRRVDTSTSVTKLWTYAGNNIASVSTKSGGSFGDTSTQEWVYTVAPGMINNVLERHKANYAAATTTSEYYQYDHRGNVAAVTDSSGKILRGYQYDAFGSIPFSFATGQSGAAPTDDILFTGKDLDPDTGLYYFNARWYDSETGRFLSRSPFKQKVECSYSFCENAPVLYVDPTGMLRKRNEGFFECVGGCICSAVAGVSGAVAGAASLVNSYIAFATANAMMQAAAIQSMAAVTMAEQAAAYAAIAAANAAFSAALASLAAAAGIIAAGTLLACIGYCVEEEGGYNFCQWMFPIPPDTSGFRSAQQCIKDCEHLLGTPAYAKCLKGCKNANPGKTW
jgi:RHS repeat-associated protein